MRRDHGTFAPRICVDRLRRVTLTGKVASAMSRFPSGVLAAVLTVLVLLGTKRTWAEGTQADALFEEGRVELTKGNYDGACDKLRRSDELDPAPGTKLNLAECEALRGRVATAYALLLQVERLLPASDVRVPIARDKREGLERRLPKVRVTLAPAAPKDTQVRVGTRLVAPAEYGTEIPLDPGIWEVSIAAAGFAENRFQALYEEGKTQSIVAQPLVRERTAQAQSRAVPSVVNQQPKQPTPPVSSQATHLPTRSVAPTSSKGYVALGLGLSATALSTVTGILTLQAKSDNDTHCNEVSQRCDAEGREAASRGRILGGITTAGLVAGALGIGLGIYWISNAGETPRSATITLRNDGRGTLLELNARL